MKPIFEDPPARQRPPASTPVAQPRRPVGVSSGFTDLDELLPGEGWPCPGVTEVLSQQPGIGELGLLMPALARLARSQQRWIAWIAPPQLPHAPALAYHGIDLGRVLLVHGRAGHDALGAAEQALASGACAAVLVWPRQFDLHGLRRLRIAARKGECSGFVLRVVDVPEASEPGGLRVVVAPAARGLRVDVRHGRGRRGVHGVHLDIPHAMSEPFFFRPPGARRPPRHVH
ncbi:cell division inhibitor SulA [Plasticicumulans lactativorans]|uniref:Cell division inhibitor SulA n=1 Tax=Plasticicumulans lactativorans TaxID=1133106 RepID=A0A4V2SCV8_9GAMM|nr:translesion DNA synthesis-associated protein ImuA [Plasticicumulans lactativorans]TCO80960.1 cell division inhibitor SulA [Plasticicumulans lactativorans]